MFAVISKPYEGFRGCFLVAGNNSSREVYIFLAVVEAGEYVKETNVSWLCLYLCSGNDFDGDQRLQIMFVFAPVKLLF
jgi:hypothetical protein